MAQQSRLTELAAQVATNAAIIERYLLSNGLPLPSFSADGPTDLVMESKEVEDARLVMLDASIELLDLLQGPKACLRPTINGTSLEAIYRWKIPINVPLDGEISYSDLANRIGMSEPNLRRILRYAIVWHRVFCEPRPSFVAHSAASRLLVKYPASFDALGTLFDEGWQALARTCDAMQTFGSDEPNQSGYSLAQNTSKTMWEVHKAHPTRGKRFASAMKAFASIPGAPVSFLTSGYPWSSLSQGSTIIDVGGSEGHASIAIAEAHSHLKFVVQDLPEVVNKLHEVKPTLKDMNGRIEYVEHDFLTPQTRQGDVYLFRCIFHDWSDTYAIKILRNLIPALKHGNKVLVNDRLMPAPGSVPLVVERGMRASDLAMLGFFNGREREKADWENLFREADPRFHNVQMWTPSGSVLSIIEATWND